jgi:hypothetical protein
MSTMTRWTRRGNSQHGDTANAREHENGKCKKHFNRKPSCISRSCVRMSAPAAHRRLPRRPLTLPAEKYVFSPCVFVSPCLRGETAKSRRSRPQPGTRANVRHEELNDLTNADWRSVCWSSGGGTDDEVCDGTRARWLGDGGRRFRVLSLPSRHRGHSLQATLVSVARRFSNRPPIPWPDILRDSGAGDRRHRRWCCSARTLRAARLSSDRPLRRRSRRPRRRCRPCG